jgi:putative transposase
MVTSFAESLISADADAVCGAAYGERVNTRNGYRQRPWHPGRQHRPGDPELRQGSYFRGWLLERRRRAEAALVSVVATSCLLASRPGGWRSWSRP